LPDFEDENKDLQDRDDFKLLSNILETGKSQIVLNQEQKQEQTNTIKR